VETRKAYVYLWTSVLYFSTVSNLVQSLVITYGEIFQARNVFWTSAMTVVGFEGVVRWKSPAPEMFFQFAKDVKIQGGRVRAVGWDPEMASRAGHILLPPGLGNSHCML
jgi:hypothetical protein